MRKIIDGVVFYRREPSSACVRGAWSTEHYHTHWNGKYWSIYETGVMFIGECSTVTDARKFMAEKENCRNNGEIK